MKTGRIFLFFFYRKGNISGMKRRAKIGLCLTYLHAAFLPNVKTVKRWANKNVKPKQ